MTAFSPSRKQVFDLFNRVARQVLVHFGDDPGLQGIRERISQFCEGSRRRDNHKRADLALALAAAKHRCDALGKAMFADVMPVGLFHARTTPAQVIHFSAMRACAEL